MAVDLGKRRIGLAISEGAGAYPLGTFERRSLSRDLREIATRLESRGVCRLVVGLPLNMDGSEGPAARSARAFAGKLGAALALPVDLFDERLTSIEAEHRLAGSVPAGRKRAAIDAVAAAIILEGWLEAHRTAAK
ncbi:MAG TPA: Holliday junction resolvase RuvX [Candidatus Binataceae bacterium]|nr:Holliday junction resolvase RuvX [Candidatus Binataceae bacterium]